MFVIKALFGSVRWSLRWSKCKWANYLLRFRLVDARFVSIDMSQVELLFVPALVAHRSLLVSVAYALKLGFCGSIGFVWG
ncbi:hypothetical protein L6452_19968 [Arctium lappa]|uniref:Uncharacterized protein n=1 Tax=Arctium lappa TaxID=4217 RepID=A0ACB9BAW7_ARCLA|nr:hypothetical protein L6452_19968 [Arctium lappa]